MKPMWKFKVETFMATWILFNSITTVMIIVDNFRKAVPETTRIAFGYDKFNYLTRTMMYAPLAFFFLLWILFNNAFSETCFYMYIRRGAIIDFPASSSFRYLLTNIRPLFFLLYFIGYLGVSFYTLFALGAKIGTIAIFLNNLVIGVGLFWWRNQSIEWKFVSVSDFIQAFPDRNNAHGNIDEVSLDRASKLLKDFTLTESTRACWSGYMRNWYWRHEGISTCSQILHHILYWGVIFGLAGLCFAYFFLMGRLNVEDQWKTMINPCIVVCTELAANLTTLTAQGCQRCGCACMRSLQTTDNTVVSSCLDFIAAPLCAAFGNNQCPTFQQCGFTSFASDAGIFGL